MERSVQREPPTAHSASRARTAVINDLWYKNAVIYALDIETYMDSNGDGCGDIRGLMERLDYLETLGVDTLWLLPFQPTPNRDNGYDISDYYGVDARFGSSGDFVEFMHDAKARGIRVISDLVVNHTSDQSRWFQSARQGADSPFHDWYVWSKKKPKNIHEGMVFPGVQDSTWTFDKQARSWYYHRFFDFQPDLDMDNAEVRAEVRRVMGYWLQQGCAGFRVDALPFILEGSPPDPKQRDLRFEYLAEFRRFLQWRSGDAVLLAEANVLPEETKPYFGTGSDGVHMMFNFWVNQRVFLALATGEVQPLRDALEATRDIPQQAQWAQFLRNHDELDLGRLTDEQRQTVFEQFGPEPRMQIYDRGIRRRLAPMLGDRARIELAYNLMFSLPGTPVLRYGDEIGMGDDLSLEGRNSVRTPMQWADERQAGFSSSDTLTRPVIDDGPWSYHRVNVESQQRDTDSLLRFMIRLIRLRKRVPEIGWGNWTLLDTGAEGTLGMRYDWRGNAVVIVHNLGAQPRQVTLRLEGEGGGRLVDLVHDAESRADDGTHRVTLEAYGSRWYRVGGLNQAMQRTRG